MKSGSWAGFAKIFLAKNKTKQKQKQNTHTHRRTQKVLSQVLSPAQLTLNIHLFNASAQAGRLSSLSLGRNRAGLLEPVTHWLWPLFFSAFLSSDITEGQFGDKSCVTNSTAHHMPHG